MKQITIIMKHKTTIMKQITIIMKQITIIMKQITIIFKRVIKKIINIYFRNFNRILYNQIRYKVLLFPKK
jgi:hypothetical protein